ncbi:MAG: sugar-binding protein [Pseudomonadota bacterium]
MSDRIGALLLGSLLSLPLAASAYDVPRAAQEPVIDGDAGDPAWQIAEWRPIDKPVFDPLPAADDFSGRYKVVWTPDYLFVLAEITDDVLIDTHADPLELYWEDDTFEIFVDEDASGGDHQFSYNAFAYHIALDNQVVDIAPFANDEQRRSGRNNVRTYPDHVLARWRRSGEAPNRVYWEARIAVFSDGGSASADATALSRVSLAPGKTLGFMVAYCDADATDGRQHFVGDVEITPVDGDRNRGYIDAGVFGRITLIDNEKTERGGSR